MVLLQKFTLQAGARVASMAGFEADAMTRIKEDRWPDRK
jgi:hypothetical protein